MIRGVREPRFDYILAPSRRQVFCFILPLTKNLCITRRVEHNYISPSRTVGMQLHVSALYVGHLQVDLTYRAAIQDVWGVFWGCWGLGGGRKGGGNEISLFQ